MPGASTSAALNRAVHRYRSAPVVDRLFVHGRAFLSDLAFVERFVPRKGFIVDLGCGHGLFACLLREASDTRRVLGIDLDAKKVAIGRVAIQDTQWLRFEIGDIVAQPPPKCDAVTIVDVLYLLSFADQERVLRNAASALGEGGPLIVKAQERRPALRRDVRAGGRYGDVARQDPRGPRALLLSDARGGLRDVHALRIRHGGRGDAAAALHGRHLPREKGSGPDAHGSIIHRECSTLS